MQMFLGAMLIDAFHAALEDAVKSFKIVVINFAANVFLRAVNNKFMTRKIFVQMSVLAGLISHDLSFFRNVSPQDWHKVRSARSVNVERADLTRLAI